MSRVGTLEEVGHGRDVLVKVCRQGTALLGAMARSDSTGVGCCPAVLERRGMFMTLQLLQRAWECRTDEAQMEDSVCDDCCRDELMSAGARY